jgi:hypothetical protein
MQTEEAKLEIGLLNAEVSDVSRIDLITRFTNKGLPQEALTRMDALWDKTKMIAGETIQIGKILLIKIWEFVKEHPNMSIGIVIGAAIGSLVQFVPFIGHLLLPISVALGAVAGGVIGHRLDKKEQGVAVTEGAIGVAEDLIGMAKEFFKFLIEIFNALRLYFSA